MSKLGRRIRAAIVMGFVWAAAGIVAATLTRLAGVDTDLPLAFLFAPLGFISGVMFSGILAVLEGRRGFERMSLSRFATWGAASGLVLSGVVVASAALRGAPVWPEFLLFGPPLVAAGAVCAAGSLALARRAEARELLGPTSDSSGAELTEDEKRELLGRGD